MGYIPILLVQQEVRALVKVSTEKDFPTLVVLSYPELPQDIQIESLGIVKLEAY